MALIKIAYSHISSRLIRIYLSTIYLPADPTNPKED